MAQDYELRDHQEWINYLQPEGLVVSARALIDAQVYLDAATLRETQERLRGLVLDTSDPDEPRVRLDLPAVLSEFLAWPTDQIDGWNGAALPADLVYENADLGVRLAPTFALRATAPKEGDPRWLMLVQALAAGEQLDTETEVERSSWKTTPSRRFERLLRETKVPIGLIADAKSIRLVFAPPQENTGTLTFPLAAMTEVAGRKIAGGFHTLLCAARLFTGPRESRLPALLERSRKAQAAVSTALAEQVLEALYELVRGLQSADARTNGALLEGTLARHPDHVYQGLLNVLLRLITLLYAEDRSLLPQSDLFVRNYSLRGLYERLRADHERHSDTMDSRWGAWHQLLVLFRLVNRGCEHPALAMPARRGALFDPERFPFLEGRTLPEQQIPLVPDGTVYRVLEKLLVVDGERLSYRTLDVEHIGSVYETMMGFRMERASGPSIALKAAKKGGAPTTIDLERLLAEPAAKRTAWVKANAEQKIDGKAAEALKGATTLEALRAALDKKIAHSATPDIVAQGAMVMQPSDERRKSGSHYTPRSLTEPIVRKTLEPIFARLGPDATERQILDLRVCDPAMGSGAFLVEACRQLAQRLKLAWERHRVTPTLPPDEDLDLYAMRLVAQRCLYGVDKNPVAADLAKLSLWLATLARDHAFTFLNHALKCGDSLVGLDRESLLSFNWKAQKQLAFVSQAIGKRVDEALALREEVRNAPDGTDEVDLRRLNAEAEAKTADVRLIGDLVIAAFFAADSDKKREAARKELEESARAWLEAGVGAAGVTSRIDQLRADGVAPFHWWLEFPEVFLRANPGFDAFCGNPPFLGGRNLTATLGLPYSDVLLALVPDTTAAADLVARFVRRAFDLTRSLGCLGVIATNTIAEGDTRASGLRWICVNGGTIYSAQRRIRWPGQAAVVICVVHIQKGKSSFEAHLDDRPVGRITAFLFHSGGHEDPHRLAANANKSFQGSIVLGVGFTFDDADSSGLASPISDVRRLIDRDPRNSQMLRRFLGGEEINSDPRQLPSRYVINFDTLSLDEARSWPDLFKIVEARVKPQRSSVMRERYRENWWRFAEPAIGLYAAIGKLRVALVLSQTSKYLSLAFANVDWVFSNKVVVVGIDSHSAFCVLQSLAHQAWAYFFGSSMKDDPVYTPTDCFETFPFPPNFESNSALEAAGKAYYEFRAGLMVRNNEGLTKTYNRFHSNDPRLVTAEILKLRELHADMDRAVLDAYGWSDIPTACQLIPDYFEEDDDGAETPKSIRYRWPDEVRDEVLARLLALNQQRYDEEVRLGLHSKPKSKGARKSKPSAGDLFDTM
jgi:hypothetical protein